MVYGDDLSSLWYLLHMNEQGNPVLGLGLAALGRPGYINLKHADDFADRSVDAMRERTWQVLDLAFEKGVRYFDAARSYGRAEEFLGSWLRRNFSLTASQAPFVASKWGYRYTAGWKIHVLAHEVKEHSAEHFIQQWKETQDILGEYLKLYQIHSATLESGVLSNPEVLSLLSQEKSRNSVEMGLSLSGPGQAATLSKALEVSAEYNGLFSSVQASFNPLEPSAAPSLIDAANSGWRVVIKEALANGRIASQTNASEQLSPEARSIISQLEINNSTHSTLPGLDAIVLAYIFRQKFVNVVLSGAATKDQLLSNMRHGDYEIPESVCRELEKLSESPAEYWSIRSKLEWN